MNSKTQISKHPYHHDPTAFSKRFPRIEVVTGEKSGLSMLGETKMYKMGKLRCTVSLQEGGYFMSVYGRDCYPTWDEIVFLRYSLIPDAAVMTLILPNLDSYINNEDNNFKFVFTLEQKGWAFIALPVCTECGVTMKLTYDKFAMGDATCEKCGLQIRVDFSTWNELHGSGYLAKEKQKS